MEVFRRPSMAHPLQIVLGLLAGIVFGFVYELGYRIIARRLKRKPVLRFLARERHGHLRNQIVKALA